MEFLRSKQPASRNGSYRAAELLRVIHALTILSSMILQLFKGLNDRSLAIGLGADWNLAHNRSGFVCDHGYEREILVGARNNCARKRGHGLSPVLRSITM
jgi:hypothetical protein